MTNLIDGNLLPSALVWITSRPAAIDKIPPGLIHRMTEVRGFTDLQKEEYFKKRISDQSLASRIISHVRNSRTLEIMCHIPVFCWITATVLEQMLKGGHEKIPSSLTELYTRFLLTQTSEKKKKYLGKRESDPRKLSEGDVQLILKLGKLAFDNLQKSNIVFSEDDLKLYDIDVTEASLRSGLFTEIVKEEDPMFSVKKYSFVHLSFQEYLAAFFVIHTYADTGVNAMQSSLNTRATAFHDEDYYDDFDDSSVDQNFSGSDHEDFDLPARVPQQEIILYDLQKCAIDEALKSKSGHLDLFLRFLLGLSLESNQKLLNSFSVCVESGQNIRQTVQYLRSKLREEDDRKTPSSERCINLLHCLLELNDHSMAEEIRRFLTSDRQAEHKLTAGQCSTLAYIILMSGDVLETLDLKKYNTSEGSRKRLVPAVRNCRKALMADCRLSNKCCETVASALQNPKAHLRELDLSQNFLGDSGLASLCAGLNSPHCRLETLNLSHINLEKKGAELLRAVLMGPHIQPHTLNVFACGLKDDSAKILGSALWSSECRLRELDLSYNKLTTKGVKSVLQGLLSPYCDIEIIRLSGNMIDEDCCTDLASVLKHSFLRELTLDRSSIRDVGAKRLCSGLMSPHCQLQILGLRDCKLSKKACFYLTVALSSYSVLRKLNLGDNDLQDSGVKLLSTGLKHPNCILQNLGLSGCMITVGGCSSLALALKSNPFQLRELDLSYNHPGELGEKLLSSRLEDRHCKLETLRLDHAGHSRITAGLWKYYQDLNMGNEEENLTCSPNRKGVVWLPVPEVPFYDYYDSDGEENKEPVKWAKVRAREQLIGGRFYWELEWTGMVYVGVTDRGKLYGKLLELILQPYPSPYFAVHTDTCQTKSISAISVPKPERIGILLDWPAGTLSFYSVSSQGVGHLYTFHTKFKNPMYPLFGLNHQMFGNRAPSVIIATPDSPESVFNTRIQLIEQHMRMYPWWYNGY
ncbi:NACHT, LRR and PYD domains-containing protein 12-like [Colossoma macropomum]|uniref:NACHT, LRR and PYD domains-containing protein 12-like n=1 Tax=Colossoma macropomum TaxID=42526 RepID=UPI0018649A59|nr:NACHT, LRR and PYD domains-containing protein 12-like [Colossoma macropomum]